MTEHVVVVTQGKDVQKTLFWGIFAAIITVHFIGWVVAAVVLFFTAFGMYLMFLRHRAHEEAAAADRAAIIARADEQRRWYESGDPRWITGDGNEGSVG